jgi:GDP-4-dehydro-6-deoxy-D-mannose reductase
MSYGLKIIRTRAFNLTGPRRGDVFVDSNFAKQIVMIEKKKKSPLLEVGNLEAFRDFTDVRDVVRAYWLAMNKCEPGEVYNISSGHATKIKDLLDMLIKISGVKVEVKQDPQRMRPSDEPVIQGDNGKFRDKTGWKPEIPLERSLKDLLDYWRAEIK